MKKKIFNLLILSALFILLACGSSNNTTSSNSSYDDSSFSEEISSKNINIKSHDFNNSSNKEIESSASEIELISSENESFYSSNSSYYSSTNKISSSEYISKDYELLSLPNNINNPIDINEWQSFSFIDSLPDNFTYIYGNNKATPDIYADEGGLVMDKNDGPRKGFQTPCFNTWNKVELRIQLGKFHGTQKSQNKNDPIFTIDCFNKSGSLIDTYYIEEINVTENSEVKTYITNSSVCYLEVRATNLPVKSNQVYNFGIAGISLKGWPYN